MKIGNIELKSNIFLAQMAGYSDVAFRRLCRDFGAGLTTTEMISVSGLNYRNQKTDSMTVIAENEVPSSVQLFGNDPKAFAKAVTHHGIIPFDIIDVNMGCPMRKVVKNGEGSALMRTPELAADIVRALKNACNKPITVKIRLGIESSDGAEEFAAKMQDAGADMIIVHGRTAKQLYTGLADWDAILRIKRALSIPIVGNGDVTGENLISRLNGLDGVAIGRGAIGNPQIFSHGIALTSQKTAATTQMSTVSQKTAATTQMSTVSQKTAATAQMSTAVPIDIFEIINRHIDYMSEYFSERYLTTSLRKFYPHYFKGIRGSKPFLNDLYRAATKSEVLQILNDARKALQVNY